MTALLATAAILAILFLVKIFNLRNELLLKNREIEELKRRGTDFVANVSHELKTPLTSIKGYTETLKTVVTKDPAKAVEFLNRIEENSDRLSHLINDILELSRIEQPNFYLEKAEFQIAPLLSEIKNRFAFAFSSRKQVFAIQNEVESMKADRWLLDQAVSNLIENAHQYSKEGAVIEIHVSRISDGGKDSVQFIVSDTGPGIKAEDLPRIFERFYRADKSRNRRFGGTGLGLAIVRHILLSHGGRVHVESELGKGSQFYLLFPQGE